MRSTAKQRVVALARRARLLPLLERGRFLLAVIRASADNSAFIKANPAFVAPPLWWMHDMYSHASYKRYLGTGAKTAAAIAGRVDAHVAAERPRVADWGCGLARVLRHLPDRYRVTGFDYNAAAIDWCKEHIADAEFRANGLAPPLPAEAGAFDAIYALSVYTHLSERGHAAWIAEIERVLAPGGVFLGTFHGAPAEGQLLPAERARFDSGELVARGGVAEGGRTFTAFHPERYLRERLFRNFDVLEGPTPFFGQTLIVARKR
jgi:SAM-dependent methyltransferase